MLFPIALHSRLLRLGCVALLIAATSGLGGYRLARAKYKRLSRAAAVPTAAESASSPEAAKPVEADDTIRVELCLPKALYAVPGLESRVFLENVVITPHVNRLKFAVNCPLGATERRRWSATPKPADVGKHPFEIVVTDLKGKELARGKSELCVSPPTAGAGRSLRMLIVGDSLTHATHYPNRIAQLFSQPGNPKVKMIGTHNLSWASPGVVHEGYNGWTWHCFLNHWDPGSAERLHRTRDNSPFVYLAADGKPKTDVARYLRETSSEGPPDLVVFQIGINDVYCQERDFILGNVETLVNEFRKAAPNASLGIWLTQAVNFSEDSFAHNYKGIVTRATICERQHRLVQGLMDRFGARENEGIYLVPISASVDPIDDYCAEDSVHPTIAGYRRIGDHVYAWMKWWAANESQPRLLASGKTAGTESAVVQVGHTETEKGSGVVSLNGAEPAAEPAKTKDGAPPKLLTARP